jgi:hypothetical protein
MKRLHLADDLAVPIDLATQAVAILGLRGSGKTNTGGVFVEELLDAGIPVAVVDPTDVWWGIKSSANGKEAGYPVLVFGGDHGDLPLAPHDGATIAEFIAKERVPVVLSVRHLRMGEQKRFVAECFQELYHIKGKERSPLCVVIDEAPLVRAAADGPGRRQRRPGRRREPGQPRPRRRLRRHPHQRSAPPRSTRTC